MKKQKVNHTIAGYARGADLPALLAAGRAAAKALSCWLMHWAKRMSMAIRRAGSGTEGGAGLAAVEIVGEGAGLLVGSFYLLAERSRCFELCSYFSATLMVGQPARSIGLSGERRESGDDRPE